MQKLWSSDQYDPVKYALAVGFIFVALWEPHDSCWRSKEEKASLACPGHHRTGPGQDDCNSALSAHLILDQTGLAIASETLRAPSTQDVGPERCPILRPQHRKALTKF